ncbi:hypothetical protein GOP47_0030568 [Adiantum capillus-veneris]|nr:hypothetical protein GOP47_0030568 [Adiantum capillus-veneris]
MSGKALCMLGEQGFNLSSGQRSCIALARAIYQNCDIIYFIFWLRTKCCTVFTRLSLFNMLISPMNSFPWVINGLIEAVVSLKRLTRFLLTYETNYEGTQKLGSINDMESTQVPKNQEHLEENAISIQNASFSCSNGLQDVQPEHLKCIDIRVSKRSIVLVLGKVGFGKSSRLQAMLGEMRQLKGHRVSKGKYGYAPDVLALVGCMKSWGSVKTIREGHEIHTDYIT